MAKKVKVWTATEEAISNAKAKIMDTQMTVEDAVDSACDCWDTADRQAVTKVVTAWEKASLNAPWMKYRTANETFELTMTDDEIESLWIVENRDDSMADNVDAFFATEDDSVNDALLFCDAVEELNERG